MRTYFNIMVYMIKIMVNIDKKYLGTFLSKNENKKGIYIIEIIFWNYLVAYKKCPRQIYFMLLWMSLIRIHVYM